MKISLPGGCSCSKLSVNPQNWQTKNPKISKDWYISYRFYDSKFPKPKQVMLKGMNAHKDITDRQRETDRLLQQELERLQNGYNPFHSATESDNGLNPSIGLISALKAAFQKATVSEITKRDLKYTVSLLEKAIVNLGWQNMEICSLSRKHVKIILENASNSSDRFNKSRSYLMILLSVLEELELVPVNFARDIKKKKVIKRIRQVLTHNERVLVNGYLLEKHPEFHRFLHIFFHSGARISELMRVKEDDVELKNQRFKILLKKGSQYREVWKTIKDIAMPYWEDILCKSDKGDFLFSKGLKPGKLCIKSYQIEKRWYRLIKKPLGITADFYSLKHLHTTETIDLLSDAEAAKHNSHTTTQMVNTVYDVNRTERTNNKVRSLNNSFA